MSARVSCVTAGQTTRTWNSTVNVTAHMRRKWVRNIVHRYVLRGQFSGVARQGWRCFKEGCVESSLRLCLGFLVLPYTDPSSLRSSTFLLQILFLRHDLEQLNAGLPEVAQFILAWPCNSRAYAGGGTATRKLSCHSPLRGRISPSSGVFSNLEA
jgi:hypothetical protein